jgi:hypothetical protein
MCLTDPRPKVIEGPAWTATSTLFLIAGQFAEDRSDTWNLPDYVRRARTDPMGFRAQGRWLAKILI